MKALQILKQLRGQNCVCDKDNHEFDEAIAELEELIKPKSCEGCKWQITETEEQHKWCGIHGTARVGYEMNDFWCNRYEPKDEK